MDSTGTALNWVARCKKLDSEDLVMISRFIMGNSYVRVLLVAMESSGSNGDGELMADLRWF